MAYTFDDPHSQASQAAQSRSQAMGRLRSTAAARSAWHQSERDKLQAKIDEAKRNQEAEAKRKSSNWLNWSLLGTAVGSAFGMPWLGAGLGTLAGMGKAHASGGDIFDFRSQLKYLDPQMATGAAMGIAGMPPDKTKTDPNKSTTSGRQFGEDPAWETGLQSTWGMSPAEAKNFAAGQMLRGGHLAVRNRRLMDLLPEPKKNGGY